MPKERKQIIMGCAVAGLVLFILLIWFVFLPQYLGATRRALESRAKSTLRAFGETELAYRDHTGSSYGSWRDLYNADFISEGTTQQNIIEGFLLTTALNENKRRYIALARPVSKKLRHQYDSHVVREDEVLWRMNEDGNAEFKMAFEGIADIETKAFLPNHKYLYLNELFENGYMPYDVAQYFSSTGEWDSLIIYIDENYPSVIVLAEQYQDGLTNSGQTEPLYLGVLLHDEEKNEDELVTYEFLNPTR